MTVKAYPRYVCETCGREVEVAATGKGSPTDAARGKLVKMCRKAGHDCVPQYLAGFSTGGPVVGQ